MAAPFHVRELCRCYEADEARLDFPSLSFVQTLQSKETTEWTRLTIQVFEDFLRKVWRDKIMFRKLGLANPGQVPIGPNAVIEDDLGFSRSG